MPAYVVYRPSVMRSGRLLARLAAVAALVIAAVIAFVVIMHNGGGRSQPSPSHRGDRAKTHASSARLATAHVAKVATAKAAAAKAATVRRRTSRRRRSSPCRSRRCTRRFPRRGRPRSRSSTATRHRALRPPWQRACARSAIPSPSSAMPAATTCRWRSSTPQVSGPPRARSRARRPGAVRDAARGPSRNLSGARLLVILGT